MFTYTATINATLLPESPFTKGGFSESGSCGQVKPKTGLKVQNSHVEEKINAKHSYE